MELWKETKGKRTWILTGYEWCILDSLARLLHGLNELMIFKEPARCEWEKLIYTSLQPPKQQVHTNRT
jgi:hypothetical protein